MKAKFTVLVWATLISASFGTAIKPSDDSPTEAVQVLARAERASFSTRWRKVRVLRAQGSEKSWSGLGKWEDIEGVQQGWIRRSSNFGLLHNSEICGGQGRWRLDAGGGAHPINSDYAKSATITDEWLARRDYLKPGAGNATMGPVFRNRQGSGDYLVVTAIPVDGQPVELWFDAKSYLLYRLVRTLPRYVETVTYSDYGVVRGLALPFTISTTESDDPGYADTVTIKGYSINGTLPTDTFAGSAQESVRVGILRGSTNSNEFGLGGGQTLRPQEQVIQILVTTPTS